MANQTKKFFNDMVKHMDSLSFDPYMLGLVMNDSDTPGYIYERIAETFICMANSWTLNRNSGVLVYPRNVTEFGTYVMDASLNWVRNGEHVYGILTGMEANRIYRMGGDDVYR